MFLFSSLSGTVLMLKGSILRFGFLDCGGALIHNPYEVWRDQQVPDDPDRPRKRKLVNFSPSSSQEASGDGHLAVVCSERQAKVFLMPSQACLYVHNITESSFVLRADVVSVCNSVCLACFCANGHIVNSPTITINQIIIILNSHLSFIWTKTPLCSCRCECNSLLKVSLTDNTILSLDCEV